MTTYMQALFKLKFNRLTAPQRERLSDLLAGAKTLDEAGQSAAASDIFSMVADFADGYRIVPPHEKEPKPTADDFAAASAARNRAEIAAGKIQNPEEQRVLAYLLSEAGKQLPENPGTALVCYEAAERHALDVLNIEQRAA